MEGVSLAAKAALRLMPPTRLAGELRAVGSQANGLPWAVALERPETGRRAVHGVIELHDLAVATSGDDRAVWPWAVHTSRTPWTRAGQK